MSIDEIKKKGDVLYEDEHLFILLPKNAATKGHLQVYSKQRIPYTSKLENREFYFTTASLAATALFELLGAQGTNIIINDGPFDGEDYLVAEVLARMEDDGLDFQWQPKQLDDTEMQNAEERIKEKTFFIGKEKPPEEPTVLEGEKPEPVTESEDGVNYMLRRLKRIP